MNPMKRMRQRPFSLEKLEDRHLMAVAPHPAAPNIVIVNLAALGKIPSAGYFNMVNAEQHGG
jgi:hypothetical protein